MSIYKITLQSNFKNDKKLLKYKCCELTINTVSKFYAKLNAYILVFVAITAVFLLLLQP